MNQQDTKAWIAALKSGEYEQGNGVLRDSKDKFCCLGVAVDVLHPEAWTRGPAEDDHPDRVWRIPGRNGALRYAMADVEINLHAPLAGRLADMNDGGGATFKEIAAFLEGINYANDYKGLPDFEEF